MSNSKQVNKAVFKLTAKEKVILEKLSRSRSAPSKHVERAGILLAYADGVSVTEIADQMNTDRSKIYRCINKAKEFGACESLDDLPRQGRSSTITAEAKAWLIGLACQKPLDLGYSYEIWTQALLAKHAREYCLEAGHPSLSKIGKGTISKILAKEDIRPHKVSYYLEKRDPDFDQKMNEVLYVYQQVDLIKCNGQKKNELPIAIISYDEKPGIQAIGTTAPDLHPVAGKYATISRDYEYVRHGTVSLLAGIDLLNGKVHGLVVDKHRSAEFIQFLKQVHKAYPKKTRIRIIMDNHSIHTSKETKEFLEKLPNRFEFIFTPKHASWLNIIEVLFSKMTRSVLRYMRVHDKDELVNRLEQYLIELNEEPVVFNWKYGLNGFKT